ncbi:hypothetical protein RQP46_006568 [Phenoliferia psychrophenolica]
MPTGYQQSRSPPAPPGQGPPQQPHFQQHPNSLAQDVRNLNLSPPPAPAPPAQNEPQQHQQGGGGGGGGFQGQGQYNGGGPPFQHEQDPRAYNQQPQGPGQGQGGQQQPYPSDQGQGHNPPYQGQGGHPQQQQQQQQQQQPGYDNHHQQPQYPQMPREPQLPQPPHSQGSRLAPKSRVKIDPDHIPSPVTVQEVDQLLYRTEPFMTCARTAAPLATTDFVAIDQGNSSPRFVRMTTYNLPHTDDLAIASQLPLGLVIQPFAPLRAEEGTVPVVDFGDAGPPRCQRCRGYINAWCMFVDGGQKFICNLCGGATEVQSEYFSHLDMSQRRMDLDQRPELRLGSVDFVVGKEYWVQDNPNSPGSAPREPQPLHYIFAIDVSYASARCGLVKEVVQGLRELLFPPQADEGEPAQSGLPLGSKVAIMTFDRTVQFFNLKPGLEQAQMLVVPDLSDMFLPLSEGFLVDPIESRSVIENLLESLPSLAVESSIVEAALGGPMKAATVALKNLGGQVNIFQTSLPTVGPGTLKHREDTKLYGTDREKTLFIPQDTFYRATAEECVESGIGVNLFLFPTQYIDVASLGVLPGITGGELFFHPRFEPVRDGGKLRAEIKRVAQRETGYSVTMRIRCSNGLRVADHFGNFFQRNVTDLEFGTLDADKAVAAKIKHEGKLDEKVDAHFQCAVLYTSATGQRRVRVHNLAVPVTNLLANVFRFADMDTTLAYIAKESITQTASKTLRQVRDQLTDSCVKALLAYRKHCASSTSPAQLILPESFKLFPLYALALMKSKALKGGPVASDVRTWHMRLLKSAGVAATVGLLYPRMFPVHTLADDVGFPDEAGRLVLPNLIRTSYVRMEPHGAYLIENGELAILWFGAGVSPQILQDLYAVENAEELDIRMGALPVLPTRLSTQLRNILAYFEIQRGGRSLPVLIARQNVDGTEIEFSNMLVEDANNEGLSYPDYLCAVHAAIQSRQEGEKGGDGGNTSMYTQFLS